jgi:hypothetical protein
MDLDDRGVPVRFLLRDHDAKLTGSFDDVFCSEDGQVLRTPIRAPTANAHAERWVQTMRAEGLDWTLVLGRRHLSGCSASTSATTTSSDRIAAWRWLFPRRGSGSHRRSIFERSGVAMCSAASCPSITRSQHDKSGFRAPQAVHSGLRQRAIQPRAARERARNTWGIGQPHPRFPSIGCSMCGWSEAGATDKCAGHDRARASTTWQPGGLPAAAGRACRARIGGRREWEPDPLWTRPRVLVHSGCCLTLLRHSIDASIPKDADNR